METLGIVVALGALSFLGWKLFSGNPSESDFVKFGWLDDPTKGNGPWRYRDARYRVWTCGYDPIKKTYVGGVTLASGAPILREASTISLLGVAMESVPGPSASD